MPADDDNPTTGELRALQEERVDTETMQAIEATEPAEADAHARRAEKARYLADKLEEQGKALGE